MSIKENTLEVPYDTRLQKKKIPGQKGGGRSRGPLSPPLNPPLVYVQWHMSELWLAFKGSTDQRIFYETLVSCDKVSLLEKGFKSTVSTDVDIGLHLAL